MKNSQMNYFEYLKEEDFKRQMSDPEVSMRHEIASSDIKFAERVYAERNGTYLSFLDDLISIWNQKSENERPEGDPLRDVSIVRRYSVDEDKEVNAIIYRLMERIPSPEHKDVDFRYRGPIQHPNRPGEIIEVYSQMYQVDIEFRVLSVKSADADLIVQEFQKFLRRYRKTLAESGITKFRFMRQGPDEKDMTHRGKNHIRPLYYRFYVEEFDLEFDYEIQDIKYLIGNKKNQGGK